MTSFDIKHLIHGFSLVLAMIIGGFFSYRIAEKNKYKLKNFEDILLVVFVFSVIGARLSYFLLYREQFTSWQEIFLIWKGGLISYGGFVFGTLALCILLKYKKEKISVWFDYLAPGFLIGLCIGRIGDYLSGEFDGSILQIPVTLIESLYVLIILASSAILWPRSRKIKGANFLIIIVGYTFLRVVVDYYREEAKLFELISPGQIFSSIVFLISVSSLFLLIARGRRKK